MAAPKPCLRQKLSAPGLFAEVRRIIARIPDHRKRDKRVTVSLVDAVMSALAVFSLKFPSLLQFDKHRESEPALRHNLKTLYGVELAPCDTQMREILDPLDPARLRPAFRQLHSNLQRANALRPFSYLDGRYLLSIDGTGQYASDKVSCPHCCVKHAGTDKEQYYHQLLGAVMVHPEQKIVLPLDVEPITRGDGDNKNDCERNAAKRLLQHVADHYPQRRFIVIEDALAANGPHILELKRHGMRFVIGAKPDGNKALFKAVQQCLSAHMCTEWEIENEDGTVFGYRYVNRVPLNDSHPDLLVNYLEYWEMDAGGKERIWSWVTDIEITQENAEQLMKAGRARWKIENETFNTLKNQGYHFEHNYGHGKHYLCSTFAFLMMLAFLIDQIQELGCRLFQQARSRLHSRRALWERMRQLFCLFEIENWQAMLHALANERQPLGVLHDTS